MKLDAAFETNLFIMGEPKKLLVVKWDSDKEFFVEESSEIRIYSKSKNYKVLVYQALFKLYSDKLRKRVLKFAKEKNLELKKVFIKDQSTRWGSCSSFKNINMNLRLVLAPVKVMDYVIYHELAHLVHLNHKKEFWQLVLSFDWNYRANRKWLKTYGEVLQGSKRLFSPEYSDAYSKLESY